MFASVSRPRSISDSAPRMLSVIASNIARHRAPKPRSARNHPGLRESNILRANRQVDNIADNVIEAESWLR